MRLIGMTKKQQGHYYATNKPSHFGALLGLPHAVSYLAL